MLPINILVLKFLGYRKAWSEARNLDGQEEFPHRLARPGPGSGRRRGDERCFLKGRLGHTAEHPSGRKMACYPREKDGGNF